MDLKKGIYILIDILIYTMCYLKNYIFVLNITFKNKNF